VASLYPFSPVKPSIIAQGGLDRKITSRKVVAPKERGTWVRGVLARMFGRCVRRADQMSAVTRQGDGTRPFFFTGAEGGGSSFSMLG